MRDGAEDYGPARGTTPIRVPGPHELARFTPEAWGYLITLERSGMLEPVELEFVVDRAMAQIDGPISLGELRALLGESPRNGGDPPAVTLH